MWTGTLRDKSSNNASAIIAIGNAAAVTASQHIGTKGKKTTKKSDKKAKTNALSDNIIGEAKSHRTAGQYR
jgi:hypothetical protein